MYVLAQPLPPAIRVQVAATTAGLIVQALFSVQVHGVPLYEVPVHVLSIPAGTARQLACPVQAPKLWAEQAAWLAGLLTVLQVARVVAGVHVVALYLHSMVLVQAQATLALSSVPVQAVSMPTGLLVHVESVPPAQVP